MHHKIKACRFQAQVDLVYEGLTFQQLYFCICEHYVFFTYITSSHDDDDDDDDNNNDTNERFTLRRVAYISEVFSIQGTSCC